MLLEQLLSSKNRFVIPFCLIVFSINLFSQNSISLSQNTNNYLNQNTEKRIFISSVEGLNIFDGLHNKIYKPSSHNMYGKNIQSDFFEDNTGKVWFCTYKAIHCYDPLTDDFEFFFIRDNQGNDVQLDYRIIALRGDHLWIHVDHSIHQWNIKTKTSSKIAKSPTSIIESAQLEPSSNHLLLMAAEGVYYGNIRHQGSSYHLITNQYCISSLYDGKNGFYLGTSTGLLLHFDFLTSKLRLVDRFSNISVRRLAFISPERLLISCTDRIVEYNIQTREKVVDRILPSNIASSKSKQFLFCKIIDNTVWVSQDGIGVSFYPFKKKINHQLQLADYTFPSVNGIFPFNDLTVITTKANGILIIDKESNILKHIQKAGKYNNFSVVSGVKESSNTLLFTIEENLFRLKIYDHSIKQLKNSSDYEPVYIPSIIKINSSKFLCSTYQDKLYELHIDKNSYSFLRLDSLDLNTSMTTLLQSIDTSNYLVSANEESVLKITRRDGSYEVKHSLDLAGGIKFFKMRNDSIGLLANSNGLYNYNIFTNKLSQIIDKDKVLVQTIYAAYPDAHENIWCISNSGILSYSTKDNRVHIYSKNDGVQATEFNTNAHLQLEDKKLLFGGVNGLNTFYPDSISLSQNSAPVIITSYNINDTISSMFGVPAYLKDMTLPYSENTLSFSFHAIDYINPQRTKVKYKLVGVDDNYVNSYQANGEVRYANLDPGNYILSFIGANADGVWNKKVKEINIRINPPWWQLWYVQLAFIFGSIALLWWIIKSYYRRKLVLQDYKLREQKLIIEKQKALTEERKRIAGEMHDDLGGGLTTIKFLSHRALTKAASEDEKNILENITKKSQQLVTNMSEIIWAMNADYDDMDSLIAYTRRYAAEYLSQFEIVFKQEVHGDIIKISLGGEKRRNIFLVIKEALHNVVKHAEASRVISKFEFTTHHLYIKIIDDGKGIPGEGETNYFGNGLKNMQERISKLDGTMEIKQSGGLTLIFKLEIKNLNSV